MKIAQVTAAGVILVVLAGLALFLLPGKQTTPAMVLEDALNRGAGLDAKIRTSIIADLPAETGSTGGRRGLSVGEAKALVAVCAQPAKWTYVGDEGPALMDGVNRPYHYSVMACRQEAGTLLARLWMDRDMVDHAPELIGGSYFLACGSGQCPDFAIGDSPLPDLPSPARPFKIQDLVTKQ